MDAIEALEKFEVVEATIWGLGDEPSSLASLSGTLMRFPEPEEGSPLAKAWDEMEVGEEAVCFSSVTVAHSCSGPHGSSQPR